MMENLSEYPLLFVEDYQNTHHEIIDNIANHETSLFSRSDTDDEDIDAAAMSETGRSPPAKRRDRRPSERSGIG